MRYIDDPVSCAFTFSNIGASGESSIGLEKVELPSAPRKTRSWQHVANSVDVNVAKSSANLSRPGLQEGER